MQVATKQDYDGSRTQVKLRKRVTAAFEAMMQAIDARAAFSQTKAFYCSGAGEWTRALS